LRYKNFNSAAIQWMAVLLPLTRISFLNKKGF
jgi:hypothetical protein